MSTLPPSLASLATSAPQPSSSQQPMEERNIVVDHLLRSGAFDDCKFSRTPRQGISRYLAKWENERHHLQTLTSTVNYVDLKDSRRSGKLPVYDINTQNTFRYIESDPDGYHHSLKDKNGVVLAYRVPIPASHITQLHKSQPLLPVHRIQPTARGIFHHRHYALWADYSPTIMKSKEYRQDLPHSQSWLDSNKPLFQKLSNTLRMLDPHMYVKFTSIDKYLPDGYNRMAGAWHGVAINEYMRPQETRGDTHINWQDFPRGYNCVVPWGTFTGGAVVLWQAKVIYQLQQGEALFFLGGVMAHQVQPILTGERNSLDLFTHKSSFDWKKREDQKMEKVYGKPRS